MRILLTGADGQVGWRLRQSLAPLGEVVALNRAGLDVSDLDGIRSAVREHRPEVVVNAAAYTAVDRAEQERVAAFRVNAEAPGVLAEESRRLGAMLVHFSTDYVFDGAAASPYGEEDAPNPLGAYGASKLAGEEAVQAAGERFLVLRTSWVYDSRGNNFARTMLRLAREREELRVVDDQRGAPTWAGALAAATARVLRDGPPEAGGVFHLTSAGETTWYHFARAVLERDPRPGEQICRRVVPISTLEYPTPAPRPAYSVLCNARFTAAFGFRLPSWEEQLDRMATSL